MLPILLKQQKNY